VLFFLIVLGLVAWFAYFVAQGIGEEPEPVTFRSWLLWFSVLVALMAVAFIGAVGEG